MKLNIKDFKFEEKYYDNENKEITFYFSGPKDVFDWDPSIFEFEDYTEADVIGNDLSITVATENENKMYINEFHPVSVEISPMIEQSDGSWLSTDWKDCDIEYESIIALLKTASDLTGIKFDY